MSRTLASKFKFVVVVLAVLAMMIPTAIPVSAAYPDVTMYLVNPITSDVSEEDGGYNIQGADVYLVSDIDADWDIDYSPGGYGNVSNSTATTLTVEDGYGEINIIAEDAADDNETSVNKKWDTIDYTTFSPLSGSTLLTFNQTGYYYNAGYIPATITDTVTGEEYGEPLQGAILNWYLIEGNVDVDLTPDEAYLLKDRMEDYADAVKVEFIDDTDPGFDPGDPSTWLGTILDRANAMSLGVDIVTDAAGQVSVDFAAWGDASVQIVVVPEYPNNPQIDITPEITTWQFYSFEDAIVPQVRWVGEKIVLEKDFQEDDLIGDYVNFTITEGEGTLEQMGTFEGPTGFNWTSNGKSVWTYVDEDCVANVILTSSTANEVVVSAAVYDSSTIEEVFSQNAFITYFLKLEAIRLSDVVGKRVDHNAGTWMDPVNPYNESFPYWADLTPDYFDNAGADAEYPDVSDEGQDRNVSQDALERVQVKGWFMGNMLSTHDSSIVDFNGDGTEETTLPAGRWILPDDWSDLAPAPKDENYKFWDIMCAPNSGVTAAVKSGPYELDGDAMSGSPVVGPFTPGIETMTSLGWGYVINDFDDERAYTTVVTDGSVDAWDAPMPAAKINLYINDGNGYFKWTDKGHVYQNSAQEYTNPFYTAMIPAHWAIPAFNSAANYKWDSFGGTDGAYPFWQFIDYSGTDVGYPTMVQIYSDNHGEAMAWLNGDYAVDFEGYDLIGGKDGVSAKDGMEVGQTTVQAMASYPYLPVEKSLMSNEVVKTWYWNGMILGIDNESYGNDMVYDVESGATLNILSAGSYVVENANPDGNPLTDDARGYSTDKMVFVWARDRDGLAGGMDGARLEIKNISEGPYILDTVASHAVSQYNWITKAIYVDPSGFLSGTDGVRTSATTGYCFFKTPSEAEIALFEKNITTWETSYGMDDTYGKAIAAEDFVVAGFDLYYNGTCDSTVDIFISSADLGYDGQPIGTMDYTINVNFGTGDSKYVYPLDDPIVAGDANCDGVIDVQDIAVIENMIMEIEACDVNGDATQNGQINMGDVVKVIRMIRNLD